MSDWSAGYVSDIGYTFGYYSELNPLRVRLPFLMNGLVCPEFGDACELGFGQGLSTNLHAAATTIRWHGTDFNPAQAGFARTLASASGAGARLYDEAFAEFCRRDDLPDFDYIGLHGIWSWISDENRHVIVDFIRRKLKVGGVLFLSYNTLPGWAAFAPIRHLMTEHAEIIGAEGRGILNRVTDAMEFAEKLLATQPLYAKSNPLVEDRLSKLKEQSRHYLAHEYFNRDWHPMHFATVADWLEPAKLQFACSAYYNDFLEGLNLTAEQQKFLNEIPDSMFRQSVRDFMVNQQFRRDYWVKGLRHLSKPEQIEQLHQQKFILAQARDDIGMKVKGAMSEATLNDAIYSPLLDLLMDHKTHTLAEMESALSGRGLTFNGLLEAVLTLNSMGCLHPAQDDKISAKVRPQTDALNDYLLSRARGSTEVRFLSSPVTGGGIQVQRFQQLFLLAIKQGKNKPADWALSAWEYLALLGEKIIKGDKTLATAEENIAELSRYAEEFKLKMLPVLKVLKII